MKSLNQVFSALRKKNLQQYALLIGCCFFSVLLITAYVFMMRAPTVLTVLPEGGDSRKQVMMIFVLAVLGCGIFTTYASGLFLRHKSREFGVLMALGASKKQLKSRLSMEIAAMSLGSCALGSALGGPLAWVVWRFFRLAFVDTDEMSLRFDPASYIYSLAFSVFVIIMLFFMLSRFIRRTNIIDVVNESRKSEPFKDIPRYYGILGIALLVGGGMLGYFLPSFCVRVLRWYAPGWLTGIAFTPAFAGLYMIMLHTVVNGWRRGSNRYKNIISTGMMKFQGRQTVRSMIVITILVAGAYFAAFYSPMMGTGAALSYDIRMTDYSFRYRADQNMITEPEIRSMADDYGVTITDYSSADIALLGVDGDEHIETETSLGVTYTTEYRKLLCAESFLSQSGYNALTGQNIAVPDNTLTAIFEEEGAYAPRPVSIITNAVTGKTMDVTMADSYLYHNMLSGKYVLSDGDYAAITAGLTDEWQESQVLFNVENCEESYAFAKALFYAITDRSDEKAELIDAWDPVIQMRQDAEGVPYWAAAENLAVHGFQPIEYSQRDSSAFRLNWQYMPQFRILDKSDFLRNMAVFLMLFIFIALVCFAAVIVITYTRGITIAITNEQVYEDLRRLGANRKYLLRTARKQVTKVYLTPITIGTIVILAFYAMIMYFNGGTGFTTGELAGMQSCILVVAAVSAVMYVCYRITFKKVCELVGIG